jgi:hypothetical protein
MIFILDLFKNSDRVSFGPYEEMKCLTLPYITIRTIKKWRLFFLNRGYVNQEGNTVSHNSIVGQIVWGFVFMLFLNEMLAILHEDARILDFVNNVSSAEIRQFQTPELRR